MGRLTNVNIDIVKIDRLFVQQLYANHFNQSFIEAVIRLCHSAGMKAVSYTHLDVYKRQDQQLFDKADPDQSV